MRIGRPTSKKLLAVEEAVSHAEGGEGRDIGEGCDIGESCGGVSDVTTNGNLKDDMSQLLPASQETESQ